MMKLTCLALALSIGAASAELAPSHGCICDITGMRKDEPSKMQEGKGPPEKTRDRAARLPPSPINIWRDEIMPELKRKRMAD